MNAAVYDPGHSLPPEHSLGSLLHSLTIIINATFNHLSINIVFIYIYGTKKLKYFSVMLNAI